jgi:hypothetical protein
MKIMHLIFLVAILFTACKEDDTSPTGTGYEIVVGDTTILITADAVTFAGSVQNPNHFNFHAYMLREYQVAINPAIDRNGGSPYSGTLLEWKNASWNLRQTFLVPPYSHDVLVSSPEVYYYNIGTYVEQFGFGWIDTYDPEADLWDSSQRPWLHPADSTLAPDNQGTIGFDGGLGDLVEFRGMWEVE